MILYVVFSIYFTKKKQKKGEGKMVQPSNERKDLCELKNVCVCVCVSGGGGYKLVVMNAN